METQLFEAAKKQITAIVKKSKEATRHQNSYLSFYEGENGGFSPHYVRRNMTLRQNEIAFGSYPLNKKIAMQMICEDEKDWEKVEKEHN